MILASCYFPTYLNYFPLFYLHFYLFCVTTLFFRTGKSRDLVVEVLDPRLAQDQGVDQDLLQEPL